MREVHVNGLTHAVPPVQPIPPHCPHSATVPAAVGVTVGELTVAVVIVVKVVGGVKAGTLPVAVLRPEAEFKTLRTLE